MISLRTRISSPALLAAGVAVALATLATPSPAQQSAARQWNEQLLAAIRRNVPNPPGHARNLFHTAAAMYNAWAAYNPAVVGYVINEKVSPLPGDVELARHEAISYAAYRVLRSRFATGAGAATSLASFDTLLTTLGYSTATGQGAITAGTSPAEVGKRAGQAILDWGSLDGFVTYVKPDGSTVPGANWPQAYNAAVNPNMALPMPVLGDNAWFETNKPLGFGIPDGTNPNLWQPLALSSQVTQNGIPIPGGTQAFVGVQGLATAPFSLKRNDPQQPWLDPFGGPSMLSTPGNPSATDAAYRSGTMDVIRASSKLNDPTLIDISPGAMGNNPLGADTGTGQPTNPITNLPYAPNVVKRGDYVRVLAEFWADGPNSETPPGHWHVLANELADKPGFVKKIGGTGPVVNNLEWDVKTYFALAGAVHDAACAAWSLKRYYSGTRPITAIRYMGSKGQSSDPGQPSYHPEGLPLEPGVVEIITAASSAPGQRHATILDFNNGQEWPGSNYIGQIAVYSWPGEHPDNLPAPSIATNQSMVRWMLAKDWLPFQRKTFNTPAFPGYISGHSTFSRSAAEVLTLITGSPLWPGAFHDHLVAANSLQIDKGPSTDVVLQWCTYYDCADQAGQSRRWGGIHVSEDDYHGRIIGSQAGISAYTLAQKYWTGEIVNETFNLTPVYQGGQVVLTWQNVRGMYHKVQWSTDLTIWTDVAPAALAYDTNGTWTDTNPLPGKKYYRVKRTTAP